MYLHHHVKNVVETAKRTIAFSSKACIYSHGSSSGVSKNLDLAYNSYEWTNSFSVEDPQPTPLVVLHGFLASKNNWNSFCKKVHNNRKSKVIAIDARNHGESPHSKEHTYDCLATDLKNFLDTMSLKKVNLLGHSMGGRTAMLFALKYPELVEKLIVADVSPISTSPSVKDLPAILNTLKKMYIPTNRTLREAKRIIGENLFNVIRNRLMLTFLLSNLIQKCDGSFGWRFNTRILLANFEQMASFPDIFNVSFKGPTLFVGGGKSDHIQKSDFPKIQKLFPNAEIKYIEGAGHWLHSEKPAEFLAITLEFLNRRIQSNEIKTESSN